MNSSGVVSYHLLDQYNRPYIKSMTYPRSLPSDFQKLSLVGFVVGLYVGRCVSGLGCSQKVSELCPP